MLTIPPLPEFSDIKYLFHKNNLTYEFPWLSNDESVSFLLSKSATALLLIIEWYKAEFGCEDPNIWLPDYFCDESLMPLRNKGCRITFYPVDSEFNPKWGQCKERTINDAPNIFILVHYFGMEKDVNRAKQFCEANNCIFVEDSAHVLYPYGDIGKKSDFIYYSPHKFLAIPDGSVLIANYSKNSTILKTLDKDKSLRILNNIIEEIPRKNTDYKWILKRLIQKIIPFRVTGNFEGKIQYGNTNVPIHSYMISNFSYRLLQKYDIICLKWIAEQRKLNLELMNYIIKSEYDNIELKNEKMIPYLGVYSMENVEQKVELINNLYRKNYLIQSWPDLPRELYGKSEEHKDAEFMTSNYFTLPVHQTLQPQYLVKKYSNIIQENFKADKIEIKWNFTDKQLWDKLYDKISYSNITQSWDYGNSKSRVDGYYVNRGIILLNNIEIGVVQALEKRIFGIPLVVRINRGPLVLPDYDNENIYFSVIKIIKDYYCKNRHTLLSIAPEMIFSPKKFISLTKMKYKRLNKLEWCSSWVDLTCSEEDIMRSFQSKWRNQLNGAMKRAIIFKESEDDFDELIKLYEESMHEKNFKGIPVELLKDLFYRNNDNKPLKIYKTFDIDGKLLAFDIIYVHGKAATYLIGWTSKTGKTYNVNNFMLYKIIISLKEDGICFFDMGGIDDIHTEDISKFKRGLCGEEYKLIGEFINF